MEILPDVNLDIQATNGNVAVSGREIVTPPSITGTHAACPLTQVNPSDPFQHDTWMS